MLASKEAKEYDVKCLRPVAITPPEDIHNLALLACIALANESIDQCVVLLGGDMCNISVASTATTTLDECVEAYVRIRGHGRYRRLSSNNASSDIIDLSH